MSNFTDELKQAKDDITLMRTYGPLMRALLLENIRDDFRIKAQAPGVNPLKKLGYKVATAATYILG